MKCLMKSALDVIILVCKEQIMLCIVYCLLSYATLPRSEESNICTGSALSLSLRAGRHGSRRVVCELVRGHVCSQETRASPRACSLY